MDQVWCSDKFCLASVCVCVCVCIHILNVIYLFAGLGLRCCTSLSLVVASKGYSLVAVLSFSSWRLLLLGTTGYRALGLQQLRNVGSVVVTHGLSYPEAGGIYPLGPGIQSVSCIGRWVLYHWATSEALGKFWNWDVSHKNLDFWLLRENTKICHSESEFLCGEEVEASPFQGFLPCPTTPIALQPPSAGAQPFRTLSKWATTSFAHLGFCEVISVRRTEPRGAWWTHSLPLHFFLCLCSGFTPRTDLSLSMQIYWLLLNTATTAISVWLLPLQATRKWLNDNYCDIWYKGSFRLVSQPWDGAELFHSLHTFGVTESDPIEKALLILRSRHSKVKQQEAQTSCSMVAFKTTVSFLLPLFSLSHFYLFYQMNSYMGPDKTRASPGSISLDSWGPWEPRLKNTGLITLSVSQMTAASCPSSMSKFMKQGADGVCSEGLVPQVCPQGSSRSNITNGWTPGCHSCW